jgi:hypothetical protein
MLEGVNGLSLGRHSVCFFVLVNFCFLFFFFDSRRAGHCVTRHGRAVSCSEGTGIPVSHMSID